MSNNSGANTQRYQENAKHLILKDFLYAPKSHRAMEGDNEA